ncbi:MAG: type II secretion system protein N [Caldimonas sp.]
MILSRRRKRPLWTPTVAASGWGESTYAEIAWDKSRGASLRWAIAGLVFGTLVALIAFAPAAWLADFVAARTDGRVLLADARGSIWNGSALPILTGGRGSRDASALPGRLEWTLVPKGFGLDLRAQQACCLNGTVVVRLRPGFGRLAATVAPSGGWVAQWPSAWLGGLGTPWNTIQLGGVVRLVTPGFTVETVEGRWRLDGRADIELQNVSSKVTTLETLGSYRMTLSGERNDTSPTRLTLSTLNGPLQLSGSGTWGLGGVRFRGEARAAAADEAALSNLLNIIGRRDGARSVISIG